MLDIEPKYVIGGGIFDIARKLTNSTLAKKIISSTATKNLKRAANSTLAKTATKNLKRAADSAIGQEIKKSVLSGVSEASKNAAEGVFQQLGISPAKSIPPAKKRKRIRKKRKRYCVRLENGKRALFESYFKSHR